MGKLAIKTVSAVLGILAVLSPARAGTVLITEQEASLPPERVAASPRAITRGPHIDLVQPETTANSPMHFQLRFQSFGGSEIDTGSLHMFYLKMPEVDITPRVARFAKPAGIDIPDAEMPTGEHSFRVEIADSEGRTRSSIVTLKIAP
jgi:hypothetical protein